MGWDVWAEIDTGGEVPAKVSEMHDYTSNTNQMLAAVGIDWEALTGKLISKVLPVLEKGITLLRASPGRFEAMNPSNGWGCYKSLVRKLETVLADFRKHPKAILGSWL